ncbi:Gfo/Idh/MocA family protein [Fuscovulum ytuae]|uniref:Gfo/Idh/MocA family oxidoreductase n=1 Tax=Fuscovulum ytuae TaxID=3042299 RepID=A0ABY8Q6R6_9RHOB|nr:Gfo/Idh/MocA family oxidoreductase [Fuscovulum sp. YMD61]WGV16543.1 Gfo/Idh/MocA family oxidoreductase [Fuscovulum sp. YMD61]
MATLGIGIIGCGNISAAYLRLAPAFKGLQVRAVADMNMAAATARAAEFGTKAQSVDDLLANQNIDVVINLTIPDAHFGVSKAILQAGKHVYSEKPLTLSLEDGLSLRDLAKAKGLSVGCAPDTFLGGAHQMARALIDEGRIGTVTAGGAAVLGHGMEHWHPNPDFFFLPGGGPMLDMGPYYIANLINLIGPVKRVAALTSAATATRTISSEPRKGEVIPVKTPTNIHALLEFANGATINLSTSWDVWHHKRVNMELYGTEGTIYLPDPNFFGGKVEVAGRDGALAEVPLWDHPLARNNQDHPAMGPHANWRTAGLADMAQAILSGRDARCSIDRALHGVEVMTACLKSGAEGSFVTMQTTCTRPAALGIAEAQALMA